MENFKKGAVRVLVATDIAARGIDIDQLPHVVNYELPNVTEDYVHRIGRTGRAGNKGEAVSLVSNDESELLRNIEKMIKIKIPKIKIENFTSAPSPRSDSNKSTDRKNQKKDSDSNNAQNRNKRRRTNRSRKTSNSPRNENRSRYKEGNR